MTKKVERELKGFAGAWREGTIACPKTGKKYDYWMKQYDEGSQFGIEGGRISKLMLKRGGEVVANYDRGWDVKPTDPDTQLALEILLHSENR